jgi:integrase
MASLQKVKQHGRDVFRVVFYDKDHDRRYLRLGSMGKKAAESIRSHVEHLADLSAAGLPIDAELSAWLDKIGKKLADQLAALGLIAPRESAALAAFLDGYIQGRTGAPNTIKNLKYTRGKLVEYFGPDRELRSIISGDADQFRQWLLREGFAAAVASKSVKTARHFLKVAYRRGLVALNPFADVPAGGERNDERLRFIDRATVDKVLDQAPDAEWRLIIALARFGGLRTPSETLGLQWSDVDWVGGKVTVQSPKTAWQGKPNRVVPLFPELRPYLKDAFDPEKVHCINRYRDSNSNLRTELLRIIKRAGVEPWPRLFHNLRASRQTELTDHYPAHVVAAWLGNTEKVAERHYLKVTDEHFQRAIGSATGVVATGAAAVDAVDDADGGQAGVEGGSGGGSRVDQTVAPHAHAPANSDHAESAKPSGILPIGALGCAPMNVGEYARQESNLQPAD